MKNKKNLLILLILSTFVLACLEDPSGGIKDYAFVVVVNNRSKGDLEVEVKMKDSLEMLTAKVKNLPDGELTPVSKNQVQTDEKNKIQTFNISKNQALNLNIGLGLPKEFSEIKLKGVNGVKTYSTEDIGKAESEKGVISLIYE